MPKDGYNAECETRAAAILRQEYPDAAGQAFEDALKQSASGQATSRALRNAIS